jgi:hypothetical protein
LKSELPIRNIRESLSDSFFVKGFMATKTTDGLVGQPRDEKAGVLATETNEDAKQVEQVDKVVKQRPREFSFKHKNPDNFESVDTPFGTFSIPAQVGSTYWAILKVFYINANKKVFAEDMCPQVAECMMDRDPAAWERYVNKENVKAYHKAEQTHRIKPANSWQDRLIGNAKTLTRIGGNYPYGKRLAERGHTLRYDHEAGKLFFFLSTQAGTPQKAADSTE